MNIFFPPNQQFAFINLFILGVFIGILSDMFTVKRRLFLNNTIVCFFDDIVLVFISGFLFLVCVFITNNGILRWYEFFSCALGLFLYKITVSKVILSLFLRIADALQNIVKRIILFIIKCLKLMSKPLKWLLKVLYRFIRPLNERFTIYLNKKIIIHSYKKMCRIGK